MYIHVYAPFVCVCVQVVKDWVEKKLDTELRVTFTSLEELQSNFSLEVHCMYMYMYMCMYVYYCDKYNFF